MFHLKLVVLGFQDTFIFTDNRNDESIRMIFLGEDRLTKDRPSQVKDFGAAWLGDISSENSSRHPP